MVDHAVVGTNTLRLILEGTAQTTGEEFFAALVRSLALAIDVQFAFVAEFTDGVSRVRTRAFWAKDAIVENVEYDLAGTPCNDVVRGKFCHHPAGVCSLFPGDQALIDLGIESYLGVPLVDTTGDVLGHLAVFDPRPMPFDSARLEVFRLFGARAAAELQRLRVAEELSKSEQRFRDLFDEAPIAYVLEDTETRFVKVNQAAMKLLGLQPEDVPGTIGMSLVAPDRRTQESILEAFAEIQQGRERTLPELELRRKRDGLPIWVQFWSRPEPDGKLTRTMIIDITDRVLAERENARLQQQNRYLQEEIKAARNFDEIIGRSPALTRVLEQVRAVGPTDATVLIMGETGTGKELMARAIHSISRREGKPMVKVNCAALPAGLVESELFGHEKGAFTGATTRRIGKFELAHGGTIFLDEIGELPLETQSKLLRVLQEGEIDRIGGARPISVDVRVIAATNRDLISEVRQRTFREDLYYRLNVFPLQFPPLRDRVEDIPLLAHYFMSQFAVRLGKRISGFTSETIQQLTRYAWPGNIRELENIIERAVILCTGDTIEIESFIFAGGNQNLVGRQQVGIVPSENASQSLEVVERDHIITTLEQTNWVIEGARGAAQLLGLHPNTLRSRMKKLGITRPLPA